MKTKLILSILFTISLSTGCATTTKPETLEDKVSYLIGFNQVEQLKKEGLELNIPSYFNGALQARDGTESKFSPQESQAIFNEFNSMTKARIQEESNKHSSDNKTKSDAFLAENNSAQGVMTTESGLQYKVLTQGTGPKPTAESTVQVNYEGKLIDGTVFDSSFERGTPVEFPLNGVIKGWTEGLQLMAEGSSFEFYIPSELAYGSSGPPSIGPNQALIFKVKLIQANFKAAK